MTFSAEEQYMLELINRARLDPDAEAARYGIGLNDGLTGGPITATAKQVLAPNDVLQGVADGHTTWMFANDTFSHIGEFGWDGENRILQTSYPYDGWGEILGVVDTAGLSDTTNIIQELHRLAFLNLIDGEDGDSDREAMLQDQFREIGIEYQTGQFTINTTDGSFDKDPDPIGYSFNFPIQQQFNASVATQNYGVAGADVFLTGVAYSDTDNDDFYSIDEGVEDVTFDIGGNSTLTAFAGGYALSLAPSAAVSVTVTPLGGGASVVEVDLSSGNVKLDLVDGSLFRTSGNLTLVSGVTQAELLGIADLSLTGNSDDNFLLGNRGANILSGNDGNDVIDGAEGDDSLDGGIGNDTLRGGDQSDTLNGGDGNDSIVGGAGADTLDGGNQADIFWGGDGNDVVDGGNGRDRAFLGTGDDVFNDNSQHDINGRDTVFGGAGNDTINGGGSNDLFKGEDGADLLFGGIGQDTLDGGAQADTLWGGDGNDLVDGGNGRDRAFLGAGNDVFNDNAQNDVNGRDTVFGGTGNDTINGSGGDDLFRGEDGNDLVVGGVGNDTLFGGNQSDTLWGGDGDDVVDGGNGRDRAFLGAGNDVFNDNAQNDANGHDTVYGGAGDDTVNGGGGDDYFDGGAGSDVLSGGIGADSFVFKAGYGQDQVTDFADDADTLILDDALWGGVIMTVNDVLTAYASNVGGDVVLDFGGLDILTLTGIADFNLLVDDISIV